MNNNVRKITDGAMMLAIVGMFNLINRQFGGIFEGGLLFLLPLPMVFYSAKYGLKDSWMVFGAMILLSIVLGTGQSLFYMVGEGLIGILYGDGIYAKRDTGKVLAYTMLIGIAIDLLSMIVFASFFGYNIAGEMASYKELLNNMTQSSSIDISTVVNVDQFLMEILILSTIMTGMMEVFITHVISRVMLKRFGFHVEKAKPITEYQLPKWTGYVGLLGFLAYYYTMWNPIENDILQMSLQGFGMAGMYFLVLAGILGLITIVKSRIPRANGLLYILLFFLGISLNIYCGIWGFLYITTDLKERFIGSERK